MISFCRRGVKRIGFSSFSGCENLKKIVLPDTVETIGVMAFAKCGIESIKIPDTVETIGGNVFSGCAKLKSVTIGNGVKCIEEGAFSGCSALSSVSFKNPTGWTAVLSDKTKQIPEGDLIYMGIAAEYLRSEYSLYCWQRV